MPSALSKTSKLSFQIRLSFRLLPPKAVCEREKSPLLKVAYTLTKRLEICGTVADCRGMDSMASEATLRQQKISTPSAARAQPIPDYEDARDDRVRVDERKLESGTVLSECPQCHTTFTEGAVIDRSSSPFVGICCIRVHHWKKSSDFHFTARSLKTLDVIRQTLPAGSEGSEFG